MRLLVVIIMISFSACSKSSSSKNILKPEKMQAVLWDYLRADIYANEMLRQDTTLNLNLESAKLQEKIFQQHKITKDQFYKSFNYYMGHRGELKDILDTIIVRQQKPAVSPKMTIADSSNIKGDLKREKMIDTLNTTE